MYYLLQSTFHPNLGIGKSVGSIEDFLHSNRINSCCLISYNAATWNISHVIFFQALPRSQLLTTSSTKPGNNRENGTLKIELRFKINIGLLYHRTRETWFKLFFQFAPKKLVSFEKHYWSFLAFNACYFFPLGPFRFPKVYVWLQCRCF